MQRVSFLRFCLLVVLVLSVAVSLAAAQDDHVPTQHEEHQHHHHEEHHHHAPVPVPEDPVEEHVDPEEEELPPAPIVEEVNAGSPQDKETARSTSAKASSGGGLVSKIKSQTNKVMDKCSSLVKKCKNMSKKDMKKAAVAVVGVWGISVGVGWLVQTLGETSSATVPAPKAGPFKKK